MRDFHAEAVRIWPFTGTSRQGGCHRDRALEVAYQPPAAHSFQHSKWKPMPQVLHCRLFVALVATFTSGFDVLPIQ